LAVIVRWAALLLGISRRLTLRKAARGKTRALRRSKLVVLLASNAPRFTTSSGKVSSLL